MQTAAVTAMVAATLVLLLPVVIEGNHSPSTAKLLVFATILPKLRLPTSLLTVIDM